MKRRQFIRLLGGAVVAPSIFGLRAAHAQQPDRMRRIGVLLSTADATPAKPLLAGLQALGHVEGKNLAIEYRFAAGDLRRLPALAAELVRLNPDVLYSIGGELAPVLKSATSTIPVVVLVSDDPVESGLVASLGRPGGNVTGMTYVHDQLAGKMFELLRDAAPHVSRIAVLWNPDHADLEFKATQRAAGTVGVVLQSLQVRDTGDFDGAFAAATRERAEALVVVSSRRLGLQRQKIGDFAVKNRLIMVSGQRSWLGVGGLLTYGPNVPELTRQTATFVDKILKGAKPADLPMQQPTKFELVINLKTAKTLGIAMPAKLLALADEVIE